MRWTGWLAVSAIVTTAVGAVVVVSCTSTSTSSSTTAAPAAMTQEQKIARGKVISWSSGCNDCHTPGYLYGTPDTTRTLSGSELGWTGPWGTTYPRNLTSDPETGIGNWTEAQIMTAFRTGVRPDGATLLPPMPWPSFAHMSDEDASALAAYIKSLPPVKHKVPTDLPPGAKSKLPALTFPPPPAWDAMNLPPPPGAKPDATKKKA